METIDWSGSNGDVWSRWWRSTDRALAPVGEALNAAAARHAPKSAFRALDVGCGPGATTLSLAQRRPDAEIVGCDISPSLIEIAQRRLADLPNAGAVLADAEQAATELEPFDLIISRHGVMFFDDPVRAFRTLRLATTPGGALIFSCFREWAANGWAAELGSAVAGKTLPPPGREPSGFALADEQYTRDLLEQAGWSGVEADPIDFDYVAGEGGDAVDEAAAYFSEIGPSARALEELPVVERAAGLERLRRLVAQHLDRDRVVFRAAVWIYSARAQ